LGSPIFDRLFDFIKSFGRFFMFWCILDPYESGLVLRFGKFHRMAQIGWNWIYPLLIERVLTANVATHTLTIGPQSLKTKDHKQLVITTVITCTISDAKKFILEINGGVAALDDAAPGAVADLVMSSTMEELEKMRLGTRLTNSIRALAEPWGIQVTRVQVVDFSPMRSVRLLQHVTQSYADRKEF